MRRLTQLALFGWLAIAPAIAAAEPAPTPPAGETTTSAPAPASAMPTTATAEPATETPAAANATPPPAASVETEKAAAAPAPPPEPTLFVDINLTTQRMVVTEDGKAKYTWAVSSGAYGYPTPVGTFKPSWMSKMWYSKQYDNAPMPHAIFFKNGAAIHATSSVHLLGTPASHGCVRLSPSNAAKLYAMVHRHGKARTEIKVHGRPKYTPPRIAKQRPVSPRIRYAYAPSYSYGYQPYAAPQRYVFPGDAPPRYFVPSSKQRAALMRKRRAAARQYYSGY